MPPRWSEGGSGNKQSAWTRGRGRRDSSWRTSNRRESDAGHAPLSRSTSLPDAVSHGVEHQPMHLPPPIPFTPQYMMQPAPFPVPYPFAPQYYPPPSPYSFGYPPPAHFFGAPPPPPGAWNNQFGHSQQLPHELEYASTTPPVFQNYSPTPDMNYIGSASSQIPPAAQPSRSASSTVPSPNRTSFTRTTMSQKSNREFDHKPESSTQRSRVRHSLEQSSDLPSIYNNPKVFEGASRKRSWGEMEEEDGELKITPIGDGDVSYSPRSEGWDAIMELPDSEINTKDVIGKALPTLQTGKVLKPDVVKPKPRLRLELGAPPAVGEVYSPIKLPPTGSSSGATSTGPPQSTLPPLPKKKLPRRETSSVSNNNPTVPVNMEKVEQLLELSALEKGAIKPRGPKMSALTATSIPPIDLPNSLDVSTVITSGDASRDGPKVTSNEHEIYPPVEVDVEAADADPNTLKASSSEDRLDLHESEHSINISEDDESNPVLLNDNISNDDRQCTAPEVDELDDSSIISRQLGLQQKGTFSIVSKESRADSPTISDDHDFVSERSETHSEHSPHQEIVNELLTKTTQSPKLVPQSEPDLQRTDPPLGTESTSSGSPVRSQTQPEELEANVPQGTANDFNDTGYSEFSKASTPSTEFQLEKVSGVSTPLGSIDDHPPRGVSPSDNLALPNNEILVDKLVSDESDASAEEIPQLQHPVAQRGGPIPKRGRARGRPRGGRAKRGNFLGHRNIGAVESSDQSMSAPKTRRGGKTIGELRSTRRYFSVAGGKRLSAPRATPPVPLSQRTYRCFSPVQDASPMRTSALTLTGITEDWNDGNNAVTGRNTVTFMLPAQSQQDNVPKNSSSETIPHPKYLTRFLRQDTPCATVSGYSSCINCSERSSRPCKFQGLRWFACDENNKIVDGPFFAISADTDPQATFFYEFYLTPTWQQVVDIFLVTGENLLRSLDAKEETEVLRSHEALRCRKEMDIMLVCDACFSGIFATFWLCEQCGRRFCSECLNDLVNPYQALVSHSQVCVDGRTHGQREFSSCTFFDDSEITQIRSKIVSMKRYAELIKEEQNGTVVPSRSGVTTLSVEKATYSIFQNIWSTSQPFLLTDLVVNPQMWTPGSLRKTLSRQNHGSSVEPVPASTVALLDLLEKGLKETIQIASSPSFPLTLFPDHLANFMTFLPFPNVTRPDGANNVVAYLPKLGFPPDTSPKLDVYFKSSKINLHCEIADVVNIMVWTRDNRKAIWEIFPRSATSVLRTAMLNEFARINNCSIDSAIDKIGDPIHSSEVYLSESILNALKVKGITPWRIEQGPGEAVFVPATCAYQMISTSNCAVIHAHFLTPQSLTPALLMIDGLRQQNKGKKRWNVDAARLKWLNYFAWNVAASLLHHFEPVEDDGKEPSESF